MGREGNKPPYKINPMAIRNTAQCIQHIEDIVIIL
jgi:hypothetical protein